MATDTGEGYGVLASDPSSGVTLSDLKNICRYVGWRATAANSTAALVRFINDVVWTLASLAPWPEYLKRDGSQLLSVDTDEYTLSETGIDKMGVVERTDTTLPLDEISLEDWLAKKRGLGYTGTPTMYAIDKALSSGVIAIKMLLFPCPTAAETLYYSYVRKPVEMVNDSDVADWPESRNWLLTNALEYIMASGDNKVYSLHDPQFMTKVHSALGDARASYLPIKTKTLIDTSKMRIRDTYWKVTS